MGKDSYKINDRETLNVVCFSSFNIDFINNYLNKSYSILILDDSNNKLSRKDFKYFLKKINEIIPIKFNMKYDRKNKRYELKFLIDKKQTYTKMEMVYCGMLIRCSYEQKNTDNFSIIAKHFINLCKLKTKIDKTKLFMIACNIYLTKANRYFNSNHILMTSIGCKILSTDEVFENLKKIQYINDYFSTNKDLENFKLIDDNYMKIIKDNGIK